MLRMNANHVGWAKSRAEAVPHVATVGAILPTLIRKLLTAWAKSLSRCVT